MDNIILLDDVTYKNKMTIISIEMIYEKIFIIFCGYCGKHEKITKHGFEIDHFVPIKIDSSKKLNTIT